MSINSPSDIQISDIFKINPYEYFIVTNIENEEKINGVTRDGIYTIGQEYEDIYDASVIISRIKYDKWEYKGKFSYEGEDINGNSI